MLAFTRQSLDSEGNETRRRVHEYLNLYIEQEYIYENTSSRNVG